MGESSQKAGQASADGVSVTPKMIAAGVTAYEEWDRFAQDPLAGKNRSYFTKRERERLTEEAMVMEMLMAIFGNVRLVRRGA